MKNLTDGLLGVITRTRYRVEAWIKTDPLLPPMIYITKIHHGGEIGERSIGLPPTDVRELIAMIAPAVNLSVKLRLRNKDHL